MHMARKGTRWVGALIAGLGLVLAATPALAGTDYVLGQFNMAGGHKDYGKLGHEAPDALIQSIHNRNPAAITIQEGCQDWLQYLDAQLADYTVAFQPVLSGQGTVARCKHASDFGLAVIYRNDLGIEGGPEVYSLGSPAGFEQRSMLCVKSPGRKLAICSIHLTQGDEAERVAARRAEAATASRLLSGTDFAGFTLIVGGDFNDDPMSAAADNFYDSRYGHGAHGQFKEVDSPCGNELAEKKPAPPVEISRVPINRECRAGGDTIWSKLNRVKFDYLFVSPSVVVRDAAATHALHSDHDPLWASVTVP